MIDVVEPGDEIDRRCLANTRAADKTDHLAGTDIDVDVMQDGFALVVAEGYVLEGDPALHPGHAHGIGILVRFRLGIDDLEDALGPRKGTRDP